MKNKRQLTDEEVVKYVREKDNEAYAEIVKRYEAKLMRYAEYLTGKHEVAQDVIQQAFIKAYVNLNSFNTRRKFSSWIYRIVHNEAMNHISRGKREIPFVEGVELEDEQDIEEEYTKAEISKIVRECIKNIPVIYGEPLSLYYLEEKQYSEISDILRIPVSTVGVRISRAKKILKKQCKNTR